MSAVPSQDHVDDRGDALAEHGLNGIRLALVSLPRSPQPDRAELTLHFFNRLHLATLVESVTSDNIDQIFRLSGGTRLPAGRAKGQVQVKHADETGPARITLHIAPVGDYSTYTLDIRWDATRIDPFFSSVAFKFRPGCFTNDCAPQLPGRPAVAGPAIDYLARDYDSFRHTLMTAMAARVPGWTSTSEADLDQVLIDLLAAAADELADYQDRVMSEATIATARKRVSLARHARLVDYHLHEGNQASTWLALEVGEGHAPFSLDGEELVVFAGADAQSPESVFFSSRELRRLPEERQHLDPRVNRLRLHTWRNARPALSAGSTSADLVPPEGLPDEAGANALRDLVCDGLLRQLVIAERLNPLTGRQAGRNPRKRQLLRLLSGSDAAESIEDRVVGTWVVRVNWLAEDALRADYSFTTFCSDSPGGPTVAVGDVSIFFGNLLLMHQGRPMAVDFREPGTVLSADTDTRKHRHYERLDRAGDGLDWTLATLPEGPLAYLPTSPDGETPAQSTLVVDVETPGVGVDPWDEVESLVQSKSSDESGDHFMVETDERRRSVLRFGNGINGRLLPAGAIVHASYQIGGGQAGNIGTDRLTHVLPMTGPLAGAIVSAWNPFDVVDGREPEPVERIRRHAPEAFRARQLRAVTLADYASRAEEVPGVSRAVARYGWTGSWRTVRLTIDPVGTTVLEDSLRHDVAAHLEAVRLIGEDIELRAPRFVPLDILVEVCAEPDIWREDLRFVLEQEFSQGWTSDGRRGFFNPDAWTFGQALHRSAIEGRVHLVAGVRHVVRITMTRFNQPTQGESNLEQLEMGFDEIVLLANDPDHLERGSIRFDVTGGRQ